MEERVWLGIKLYHMETTSAAALVREPFSIQLERVRTHLLFLPNSPPMLSLASKTFVSAHNVSMTTWAKHFNFPFTSNNNNNNNKLYCICFVCAFMFNIVNYISHPLPFGFSFSKSFSYLPTQNKSIHLALSRQIQFEFCALSSTKFAAKIR